MIYAEDKILHLVKRHRKLEVGMIDIYYVEDDSGIAQIVKEYFSI